MLKTNIILGVFKKNWIYLKINKLKTIFQKDEFEYGISTLLQGFPLEKAV